MDGRLGTLGASGSSPTGGAFEGELAGRDAGAPSGKGGGCDVARMAAAFSTSAMIGGIGGGCGAGRPNNARCSLIETHFVHFLTKSRASIGGPDSATIFKSSSNTARSAPGGC